MIEAATVIEQIDDVDRLRRRLERDPGDHIASTQLEAVYRARGDWEALVRVLLDRAELLEPFEAVRLLTDVAEIYFERIGDGDAALVVLQTAFAQSPDSARLADRLCELAGRLGRWEEVIDLFVVHAAKLQGRADAVASELWLRVAWAHLAAHDDVEAAAAALERVDDLQSGAAIAVIDRIEASANSIGLLRLLAQICLKLGDEARLLRTLNRLLAELQGQAGAVDVHYDIARISLYQGDVASAEWHLVEVLRLQPTHAGAVDALMDLYKQRGEFLKAARLLEVCQEHAANPVDRVHLSFEAANLYAGALDENTVAFGLYESALALDPEHVGAALPLADRYYREERWHQLEPIIDMLVRRASALGDGAPPLAELCRRAAETAAKLGKHEKARRYYDSALTLRPDDLESLLGISDILLRSEAWDEAAASLSAALGVLERRGDMSGCAEVLAKLGRCAEATYDVAAAIDYWSRALRLQPSHGEALAALAALCERQGDFARAVEIKRIELGTAEPSRRVRLLADIGRITSRNLRDPARAITIFQQALEIDGSDREVLHQLVEHYSAAGWWEDAVAAIERIVELENNSLRKGKYLQAAAIILRKEVGDVMRAADLYDHALDCFYGSNTEIHESLRPSCMKAFKDVGKMLAKAQQWKRLEQSYRRMIKRIDPNDPVAADLWHGLGEIYRQHLGHRASAIGSFEIAAALDDKRLTRHRILVDLYESAGPEKALEAIERRHRLLRDEPLVADHYKALRKLYARTKQYDRAWSACRALAYLGKADEEERAFLDSRMPRGYERPTGRFSEELWRAARDPRENQHITAILGIVAEAAALATATPQKALGLEPNVAGTNEYRNLVQVIADTLGVEMPETFVHPAAAGEVLWANAKHGKELVRTIAIGRDLYQGRSARYMVGSIARALVYSRPAYLLRMAASSPVELEAIFLAAASLSRADVPVPPALMQHVVSYRRHLESRLDGAQRQALATAVERYVAAGEAYDLVDWCRSVDATSRRVALLVCGDLEIVSAVGGAQVDEAELAELLRYSVSDAHATLRRHLGWARD